MASEPAKEKAEAVRRMFSSIAGRYDLLNSLLSLGRDRAWREAATACSGVAAGDQVVDVATGTGELAFELSERVGREGRVVGIDYCPPMLRIARQKARRRGRGGRVLFLNGRAENLPFRTGTFDCATIAFALRNVSDLERTLGEMVRVLRRGGRVVVLEFARPRNLFFRRLYYLYFLRILPRIGGLVSGERSAYAYLPDSVLRFPSREELVRLLESAGLREVEIQDLTGGIVGLYVGRKGEGG
jgi:demethylmenaquinone methyltransferase/2-methoxy-6-polyprenyl-1,4-benzoquinol methylase